MRRKTVWISCILAALFSGRAADASVIMTLIPEGPNVVATGSGTVDLTDLIFANTASTSPNVEASSATLLVGTFGARDAYNGISGPTSFGSGGLNTASTTSGDLLGIAGGVFSTITAMAILVPTGYTSGTSLSGTATWDNTTLAALGVNVGTYTWTWGSGVNADSLTLMVLPEPGSALLVIVGLAALAALVRFRAPSKHVRGQMFFLEERMNGR